MKQVKVCPDCEVEYYPHIHNCADCGAVLLLPEEIKKAQEEKKRTKEKGLEDQVLVREGELKWLQELYDVLINSGIPCTISGDDDCNKGCCGGKLRLMVSSPDFIKAKERIDEYYMEIHPEIRTSNELASQGKCPACGSSVGSDAVECHDCGLTLLITE